MYVIFIVGAADLRHSKHEHKYLVEFVPDFMNAFGRLGPRYKLVSDRDESKAKKFASREEAFSFYRTEKGVRLDGKPNRPLTAYTVEILPVGVEPLSVKISRKSQ